MRMMRWRCRGLGRSWGGRLRRDQRKRGVRWRRIGKGGRLKGVVCCEGVNRILRHH